jgi:HlyD family type I secretion membrane fusion protein
MLLPVLARRSSELSVGTVATIVGAFESETAAVVLRTSPRNERLILHVLAGMIVLAIVLMSLTKLERVVTSTSGRIVPLAGSFFIQPYDKAIIREIHVKPGDIVRKGQILATLDPTFATADLRQLKFAFASGQALVDRLQAERDGEPYAGGDQPYQVLQLSLWRQRQAEYRAGIADFDARMHSVEETTAKAEAGVENFGKRLEVATQIETIRTTLQRDGWGSKLNTVLAADNRIDMARQLAESQHLVQQSRHDLDSLKARRLGYIEWWHDDLNKQLVQARNDLGQSERELAKAQRVQELVEVTTPRDAIVLKVGNASVGSVVSPVSQGSVETAPLFTLNPLDGPLEADINISARDIGFIRAGDPVEIKLDAYKFMLHGTAKGVVKTISEGSFTLDDNQQPIEPYFRVRVAITEVKLHHVPTSFRLIPGMTLTADIKVGHRTLMSYLVEGALRTGSEAMREP